MKKRKSNAATKALKNLCWTTPYRTAWQDIQANDVESLVNKGADIYAPMPTGESWITDIFIIGNMDVANRLVDIGAINPKDNQIKIVCAALIGNHKTTKMVYTNVLGYKTRGEVEQKLKNEYAASENTMWNGAVDVYGRWYSSSFDYRPTFEKLFQNGLNPDIRISAQYPSLLLMSATRYEQFCDRCDGYCQTELMKQFIAHDVTLEARDQRGDDVLMIMSRCGENSIVQALLNKGAHPNRTNKKGDSALIQALQKGQIETAVLLIKNGARLTYRYKGQTKSAVETLQNWCEENYFENDFARFEAILFAATQEYTAKAQPSPKSFVQIVQGATIFKIAA